MKNQEEGKTLPKDDENEDEKKFNSESLYEITQERFD
jgi:hypothetical protein